MKHEGHAPPQSWGSHPINHALSRRQVPSCVRLEPYFTTYPQARCTASQSHLHTHTHRAVSSTQRPAAQPPTYIQITPVCKSSCRTLASNARHHGPRACPATKLQDQLPLRLFLKHACFPSHQPTMVHTSKQQAALPLSLCRQLPLQICILLSVGLKNATIRSIGGGLRREE